MNKDELPNALIPEDSILAMMIVDSQKWVTKAKGDGLTPSMFFRPENQRIYQTIINRHNEGQECDVRSVIYSLQKSNTYELCGGDERFEILLAVADAPVTPSQFVEHLSEVRDTYARRKALKHAEKAKNAAMSGETAQDVLDSLKIAIEDIKLATVQKKAFSTIKTALNQAQKEIAERMENGDLPGISTGINQLDNIGGGMKPGELWIIGGKTSAGKSALSYQIINPALDEGGKVLIFTLEMGVSEVASRLISCRGRINMRAITNPRSGGHNGGGLSKHDLENIRRTSDALCDKELLISDEPGMSMDYIVAQSESEAELGPIAAIVVDYAQLIQGARLNGENREQELSRYSKNLKQLAKKLKCTVISPVQLNDEGRIRESRSLSHDADVCLSICDDGIRVDKWRSAARDQMLPLVLVGEFQRFELK